MGALPSLGASDAACKFGDLFVCGALCKRQEKGWECNILSKEHCRFSRTSFRLLFNVKLHIFWVLKIYSPGKQHRKSVLSPVFPLLIARRHGSHSGLFIASSDGRRHDAEVDPKPADERLRGRSGLREKVGVLLRSFAWLPHSLFPAFDARGIRRPSDPGLCFPPWLSPVL